MDSQIFYLINNLAAKSPILDQIGIFFTSQVILILVATATVLAVRKGKTLLVILVIAIMIVLLADQLLNLLIGRPRPFVENQVNLLIAAPSGSSFPSTHAAISAAAATVIFYFSNWKYLKIVTLVSAFLVGVSRIFVGVHYPLDVLAGFIIGVAAYTTAVKLMVRLRGSTALSGSPPKGSPSNLDQSRKVDGSTTLTINPERSRMG